MVFGPVFKAKKILVDAKIVDTNLSLFAIDVRVAFDLDALLFHANVLINTFGISKTVDFFAEVMFANSWIVV